MSTVGFPHSSKLIDPGLMLLDQFIDDSLAVKTAQMFRRIFFNRILQCRPEASFKVTFALERFDAFIPCVINSSGIIRRYSRLNRADCVGWAAKEKHAGHACCDKESNRAGSERFSLVHLFSRSHLGVWDFVELHNVHDMHHAFCFSRPGVSYLEDNAGDDEPCQQKENQDL